MRSKKHLENEKQNEMIKPEWLFQQPVENKINKIFNPKSLKQKTIDNFKLDDKQVYKELAEKMNNPLYFTVRKFKVGFKLNLDNCHINHAISKLTITPNYPEIRIEVRYINKIIKELSVIYVRLINQFIFQISDGIGGKI